jgi:glutathione-regulated potassium-efflux system protein KefB
MRTAEMVRSRYPAVPVYARARDRAHAHRLLDLGIKTLRRETFLSALDLTRQLLVGLGLSDRVSERAVATFRTHDERRLIEDYKLASDMEKLQHKARSDAATLERLFQEDAEEEAKLAKMEARQHEAKATAKAASKSIA